MAIRVGRRVLSFFVSSWIIIHLGMKPVRGRRPPSDKMVAGMVAVIRGVLFHVWDRESVVVVVVEMSSMNMVSVIVM